MLAAIGWTTGLLAGVMLPRRSFALSHTYLLLLEHHLSPWTRRESRAGRYGYALWYGARHTKPRIHRPRLEGPAGQ
jgi:hypothetical protein